ncbi:hypothetical protein PF010_g6925 [Phytophthora fragariae]|uniref:Uncharacterized protein n=1 Tax=Phytophthora fragariae TaxID=53985 RepID=A0A6G0LIX6_9STRA|nr:hypothetical protein PF010_g6925 [Phytophthora fragariae]
MCIVQKSSVLEPAGNFVARPAPHALDIHVAISVREALLLSETLDAAPSSPRIVSRNSGASFLYGELVVAFMPSLAEPPLPDALPPADGV